LYKTIILFYFIFLLFYLFISIVFSSHLKEGIPIAKFMDLKDDLHVKVKKLKMTLSDLGTRLILKMIFFDNFIHGDLHPGKKKSIIDFSIR
jgi:cbb3-type cytochrome oxidase subunit 3